jgi:hypothetical protein
MSSRLTGWRNTIIHNLLSISLRKAESGSRRPVPPPALTGSGSKGFTRQAEAFSEISALSGAPLGERKSAVATPQRQVTIATCGSLLYCNRSLALLLYTARDHPPKISFSEPKFSENSFAKFQSTGDFLPVQDRLCCFTQHAAKIPTRHSLQFSGVFSIGVFGCDPLGSLGLLEIHINSQQTNSREMSRD